MNSGVKWCANAHFEPLTDINKQCNRHKNVGVNYKILK